MKQCVVCFEVKRQDDFKKDRRLISGISGYCKKCHNSKNRQYPKDEDAIRANGRRHYEKNKDARNEIASKYKKDNHEWIRTWRNNYQKERRNSDVLFRVSQNIRSRVNLIIRKNKEITSGGLKDTLGCSLLELKSHIEKRFVDGMSWDNYGEWHLDHIMPLISAKTSEELNALCHYTNMQPLWAVDNLRKGAKTTT